MKHFLTTLVLVFATALPAAAASFPTEIPLPDGFAPEGVATGDGSTFYAGSLSASGIFVGDLQTGMGHVMSGTEGLFTVGLDYENSTDTLWAAGGPQGYAASINPATGEYTIIPLPVPDTGTFVNDVVVTGDAAYLTDSFNPIIYEIPLTDGVPGTPTAHVLSGPAGQAHPGFGLNGIVATPNGSTLIVVLSNSQTLARVDAATWDSHEIEIDGALGQSGDGLLLQGRTLWVVVNQANKVKGITLSPDLSTGSITSVITNEAFDVPTTVASFGNRLVVVNARFGTNTDNTFSAVQVSKK